MEIERQNQIRNYLQDKYGAYIANLLSHLDDAAYFYAEEENGKYIYKVITGDFTDFGLPNKEQFEMNRLGDISDLKNTIIGEIYGRQYLKNDVDTKLADFLACKISKFNVLIPMDLNSITYPDRKMWISMEMNRYGTGKESFLFGKIWDATGLGIEHEKILRYAYTDRITQMLNRNALDLHDDNIKLSNDKFVLINIDNFNKFNSEFGYDFGDKVLQTFSETIIRIPVSDEEVDYYRISADEFLIRLHDHDLDFINTNLLQLKRKMRNTDVDGQNIKIQFSFGIVDVGEISDKSLSNVLHLLDNAMRNHKKSRNILRA